MECEPVELSLPGYTGANTPTPAYPPRTSQRKKLRHCASYRTLLQKPSQLYCTCGPPTVGRHFTPSRVCVCMCPRTNQAYAGATRSQPAQTTWGGVQRGARGRPEHDVFRAVTSPQATPARRCLGNINNKICHTKLKARRRGAGCTET